MLRTPQLVDKTLVLFALRLISPGVFFEVFCGLYGRSQTSLRRPRAFSQVILLPSPTPRLGPLLRWHVSFGP
jgi:hypothetical protein